MSIVKNNFGKTKDGKNVDIFTLTNSNNSEVKIMTYGATLVSLVVPDKNGLLADVVHGYENIEAYEKGDKFFGAAIGRCGNRIAFGKFTINGKEYSLAQNNGKNHLHGGIKGFDKVVWNAKIIDSEKNVLAFSYLSKNGEEGYPGNLNATITYTFTDDNALRINYKAVSDKDTVVNLTNHSYFNLTGNQALTALNHKLMINSDEFTEADEFSIPTGKFIKVSGTPMDFRELKTVGAEINEDYYELKFGGGYDHNWMLNTKGNLNEVAAKLVDEATGRVMEVHTTTPAMQFYSANFLDGSDIGKGGIHYEKRSAICLETQYVPNAINDNHFESPLLKAGEEYNHTTIYKFSTIAK